MQKKKELFKKFNRTNLARDISHAVSIKENILRKEIKEYIWPRLDFLHGSNKEKVYYIFEESYTETEWKDMISVHYINTSYNVKNTVMRVHLFGLPELKSDYYIGFFTLRKIDETQIMLSYIFPNWNNIRNEGQKLCVMSYKKSVHIMGKELWFHTYPLFVQDNITVACSQADIISLTLYLHHKYDYRRIRILDLNKSFSFRKKKLFPTAGLSPTQMIEIFNSYDIPIGYFATAEHSGKELSLTEIYYNYIDYIIESGLPIILGMSIKNFEERQQSHVVQIIGHTQQNRDEYIIYDDSGYFLKNSLNISGFVATVTWEQLKEHLDKKSFILYPIHEKVYMMYDDFKKAFDHLFRNSLELVNLEGKGLLDRNKTRYLLADNRIVKRYLKDKVLPIDKPNESLNEEIYRLLELDMPHYVWLCEVKIEGGFFVFIADPTLWKLTKKNIFYNTIPIFSNEHFGLLNYI